MLCHDKSTHPAVVKENVDNMWEQDTISQFLHDEHSPDEHVNVWSAPEFSLEEPILKGEFQNFKKIEHASPSCQTMLAFFSPLC